MTPAYAGSRPPATAASSHSGVHPRVCGKQPARRPVLPMQSGPFPRVREAPASGDRDGPRHGSIPTCAGEQPLPRALPIVVRGPSPRARGAGAQHQVVAAGGGAIPACTGSSRRPTPVGVTSGDHPRVRGGQARMSRTDAPPRGPSPRARGADSATSEFTGAVGHSEALSPTPALHAKTQRGRTFLTSGASLRAAPLTTGHAGTPIARIRAFRSDQHSQRLRRRAVIAALIRLAK